MVDINWDLLFQQFPGLQNAMGGSAPQPPSGLGTWNQTPQVPTWRGTQYWGNQAGPYMANRPVETPLPQYQMRDPAQIQFPSVPQNRQVSFNRPQIDPGIANAYQQYRPAPWRPSSPMPGGGLPPQPQIGQAVDRMVDPTAEARPLPPMGNSAYGQMQGNYAYGQVQGRGTERPMPYYNQQAQAASAYGQMQGQATERPMPYYNQQAASAYGQLQDQATVQQMPGAVDGRVQRDQYGAPLPSAVSGYDTAPSSISAQQMLMLQQQKDMEMMRRQRMYDMQGGGTDYLYNLGIGQAV